MKLLTRKNKRRVDEILMTTISKNVRKTSNKYQKYRSSCTVVTILVFREKYHVGPLIFGNFKNKGNENKVFQEHVYIVILKVCPI